MSTYGSNSADIEDGSSKQLRSATFEAIVTEDEFSLQKCIVRKGACSFKPSDSESSKPSNIEEGESERQLLAPFEEIARHGLSLYEKIDSTDECCLKESTVRTIACTSNPSDIEDVVYKRQRLAIEDTNDSVSSIGSVEDEDGLLADYVNLKPQQKDKLNSFLEEILTRALVDFSSPEIKDIQSAVTEMIERIKTWINERDVFSISRTKLCGSIAEETATWKRKGMTSQPYIEFDFLAVLQAAIYVKLDCPECFYVNTPPVNLELLEQHYRSLYHSYLNGQLEQNDIVDECFIRETNNCLASCGCLNVKYPLQHNSRRYTFEPSSTCSETLQGCDMCTVDRPTGTLQVKTSVEIGGIDGEPCSWISNWASKAKTLCTRDQWCLPENEKMDNLAIHIDFLPALELFQSNQQSADVAACSSSDLVLNPPSSEYEHYCFLVPKHCNVCDIDRDKGTWRRSGSRAETDTVVNKMSNKHRKCYQVLKYLTGLYNFNNYHLKIAVLHHNSSCSDAGEDCAKCVFNVLDGLQYAYETKQLKSLHSQGNLLEQYHNDYLGWSKKISRLKKAICSAVSESDSVSSFLEKVWNLYVKFKYD